MSYNSNPSRQEYIVSAITTLDYFFNFHIFDETEITVWKVPDGEIADDITHKLTLNIDYTVTINNDLGGNITLTNTPTINDSLVLQRTLQVDRVTDYVSNGGIYANDINTDQNYQTYLIADGLTKGETHLKMGEAVTGVSTLVPSPIPNGYFRWNDDGSALVNDTTYPDAIKEAVDSAGYSEASQLTSNSYAIEPFDTFVKLYSYDPLTELITFVDTTDYSALHYSETSESLAQAKTWEAEANAKTSKSYSDEAEDVFVKIYTSNGDGTFNTVDTTDYSSFHYSEKSDTSSVESEASNVNSQLRAWESEAEKMTSRSYAIEPEDVFVKIYTSNGDGTFIFTNSTEYSAFHWKEKAQGIANISLDGLTDVDTTGKVNGDSLVYELSTDTWKPSNVSGLETPTITSPAITYGGSTADFTITNYSADITYIVTANNGAGSVVGDTISWTFTDETGNRNQELYVKATKLGFTDSGTSTTIVSVLELPIIADQQLVYDAASMTEFTTLTNTQLSDTNTKVEALAVDTTNIIATAGVDTFDTATQVVDGNVINVDGTDMAASGVTGGSIVSNVDPFGDGSLIAKYELDGNTNDTTGTYNGTATDITYGTGKYGNSAIFNAISDRITTTIDRVNSDTSYSMWVNPTNNTIGFGLISTTDTTTASNYFNQSFIDTSGKLRFGIGWIAGSISTTTIPNNSWTYITLVKEGSNYSTYINGVFEAIYTNSTTVLTNPLSIGDYNGSAGIGSIDQVEIYDRALTQQEIDTLYTQSSYTVPTTTVTAGATPTTAYINEKTALSEIVTQGVAETDWKSCSAITQKLEFPNISDATSSANTLVTYTPIADGDDMVILLDDEVTYVEFVASGVTGSNPWTLDTTAQTAGESPSRCYSVGSGVNFDISQANEAVKSGDSYAIDNLVSSIDPFGDGSLVAKYEMEDNTTTVVDTTGTYNGTPVNVANTAGRFSGGGQFNNTNSAIRITGDFDSADWSVSMFAKADGLNPVNSKYMFAPNGGDGWYSLRNLAGTTNLAWVLGNSERTIVSGLNDTNIHHYCITLSGTLAIFYIDKIEVDRLDAAITRTDTSFTIGANRHANSTDSWNGMIDQVEIYDRALTQQEIDTLYTPQSGLKSTRTFSDVIDPSSSQTIQTKASFTAEGTKQSELTCTLNKLI